MDIQIEALIKRVASTLAPTSNGIGDKTASIDWAALDYDVHQLLKLNLKPSQISEMVEQHMSAHATPGPQVPVPSSDPGPVATPTTDLSPYTVTQLWRAWRARIWLAVGALALAVVILTLGLSFLITQLATSEYRASNQQYQEALDRVPATMSLQLDQTSLTADSQNTALLTITLTSLLGNPVPDGTEVNLQVSPAGAGAVDPPIVVTSGGRATASFKPAILPGKVEIKARSDFGLEKNAALQLVQGPKPILNAKVSPPDDPGITPGAEITFTLTVENSGEDVARSAQLVSTVPTGTTYVRASNDATASPDGRTVIWPIDNLAPGDALSVTLVVLIHPEVTPGTAITTGDYYIQYPNGFQVSGDGPASVSVERFVTPTGTPTATVSTVPTPGSTPSSTPGSTPGSTATTGAITGPAPTTVGTNTPTVTSVYTLGHTIKPAHLFSQAFEGPFNDPGRLETFTLIRQLPANTQVELRAPATTNPDFYSVALTLTLSSGLVDRDSEQIIRLGQVAVGEDPEAPPNNSPGERMLTGKALRYHIRILDSSDDELVRARIEGWMFADLIAPDE